MNSFVRRYAFLVLAVVLLTGVAEAASINVYPSVSPNPSVSASFDAYNANAVAALRAATATAGTPGTPSYYSVATSLQPGDPISTSFPSWRGVAPPPSGYAGQLGNYILFGVAIQSNTPFSLADVLYSEDFFGSITTPTPFFSAASTYNIDLVGVSYGGNGVLGGGDDVIYDQTNPGTGLAPINELYFAGFGNTISVTDPADLAAAIDFVAYCCTETLVTGTYSIPSLDLSGSGSLSLSEVPEPGTIVTLGIGLMTLLGLKRRRR